MKITNSTFRRALAHRSNINEKIFTSKPYKVETKVLSKNSIWPLCTYLEGFATGGRGTCPTLGACTVLATFTRLVGPRVKLIVGGFPAGGDRSSCWGAQGGWQLAATEAAGREDHPAGYRTAAELEEVVSVRLQSNALSAALG